MKKLFFALTIVALMFFGCSKNNNQTSEKSGKQKSEKVAANKKSTNNVLPGISMKDQMILAKAETYDGSLDSDAVIITRSASDGPVELDNSEIGLKMPDGNIWATKKEGNKAMLVLPDDELIQVKKDNHNITLINEKGETYKVRMIGHNLVAVRTNKSKVNVASK